MDLMLEEEESLRLWPDWEILQERDLQPVWLPYRRALMGQFWSWPCLGEDYLDMHSYGPYLNYELIQNTKGGLGGVIGFLSNGLSFQCDQTEYIFLFCFFIINLAVLLCL